MERAPDIPIVDLLRDKAPIEHAAIIGKFLVMQELHLAFTNERMLRIARHEMRGYDFIGAIRKTWSGLHGDTRGCDIADIEIAAEMLGVTDDVFPADMAA